MASTPVTQYTIIKPKNTGLNNLFTRLETIRQAHLTASQNAGSSTTGITSAFATNIAVAGNKAERANVTQLKTDIDAIASSGSFTANKGSVSTAITVPAIGNLITASGFNGWNTVVTNMEGVCANYSKYGTKYSSQYGGAYGGHYGGQYGSQYGSHYLWYTQCYTNQYSKSAIAMPRKIKFNIEEEE